MSSIDTDYGPHEQPWQVQCDACRDGVPHYWHWFAGCTCAAGGCYTEHSGHCNLDGRPYGSVPATLVYDDALLRPWGTPLDRPPLSPGATSA